MDLEHSFTVPTPVEETWAHFQDIAAVAECFPGAQVTAVTSGEDGDSFEGTCKVKLGPIALVYAGSGKFTERDDQAHRFVVEAKGKDKRGNGTAGATVTLSMADAAPGTSVDVLTDLAITGKPAQFGRGVMQDVSDKLLGQFIACLEQRLAGGGAEGPEPADQDAGPASQPTGAAAVAAPAGDADAGPASAPIPAAAAAPVGAPVRPQVADDDALDLGSALLPVLLKNYGKPLATLVVGVLLLAWIVRRLRD